MATTREALRAHIANISAKIHEIKESARTKKSEKYAYFQPDGTLAKEWSNKCSWKSFFTYDHINPRHEDWHSYRHLRREASICLTAMAILKAIGEDVDLKSVAKKDALAALRDRAKNLEKASGQAGFRHDHRHAAIAWRRLKKIAAKAPSMKAPAKKEAVQCPATTP